MDLVPKGLITWKFKGFFFSDLELRLMSGNSCVLYPDEQQCQLVYEFFSLNGGKFIFIYLWTSEIHYCEIEFFFLSIQLMKRFTIGNYKTSYQQIL